MGRKGDGSSGMGRSRMAREECVGEMGGGLGGRHGWMGIHGDINTGGARFQPVGSWTGFRMGTVSGFEWERPPVSNGKGARFRTDREMRFRMAEWQFRMAGTRFRTIRGNPVSNVSAGF